MQSKKSLVVFLGVVLGLCAAVYVRGRLAMSETPARIESDSQAADSDTTAVPNPAPLEGGLETATFGNGCFWCTEAVFQRLKGVDSVMSGYSGGSVKNPTYQQVCTGTTGHAEALQITFDPGFPIQSCWKFSGRPTIRPL